MTTPRAYHLVNVFAETRFGGNPLAVFEDGSGLTDAEMQAIAAQMNLSETVFLFPPRLPGCDAHVRIFTPGYELPFAGHPTLGSAAMVRRLGRGGDHVQLGMAAGVFPVRAEGERWATGPAHPPDGGCGSPRAAPLATWRPVASARLRPECQTLRRNEHREKSQFHFLQRL
jgi:predicted PhzF superfamily epimerase YddE/YHI9